MSRWRYPFDQMTAGDQVFVAALCVLVIIGLVCELRTAHRIAKRVEDEWR